MTDRDDALERVKWIRARQSGTRWTVEREIACINGLSAWFEIASCPEEDEQSMGYTDGAYGTAEDRAREIAAALIAAEAQSKAVAGLVEVVRPFAALAECWDGHDPEPDGQTWTLCNADGDCMPYDLTPGDFRRARQALSSFQGEERDGDGGAG